MENVDLSLSHLVLESISFSTNHVQPEKAHRKGKTRVTQDLEEAPCAVMEVTVMCLEERMPYATGKACKILLNKKKTAQDIYIPNPHEDT